MAKSEKQTGPLSPEQAAAEIDAAGKVSALAQIALLGRAGDLAAAQSVRLRRESLRLAERYGANSPRAQRAVARIEQHKSYVQALAIERSRASVDVPPSDPKGATIYGRVFAADGKPMPRAVVEAIAVDTGKPLDSVKTDPQGGYLMKLAVEAKAVVFVRASDPKTRAPVAETSPVEVTQGSRVFRDLRGSAALPKPPPTPDDGAGDRLMPNVVGMSQPQARAALTSRGVTSIEVQTEQASETRPDQVIAQKPAQGTKLTGKSKVLLVVSAAPSIKVPDLSKRTLQEATVMLNQANLAVGKVTGSTDGIVAGQTPEPGKEAPAGAAIDLRMGRKR